MHSSQSGLSEEDECPICHRALPPKGPEGSEIARERHIAECIDGHFTASSTQDPHPPHPSATEITVRGRSASSSDATNTAGSQRDSSAIWRRDLAATAQERRRTTGILVYSATEKDCRGEDGEGIAECVICFEEFAVGDEMGRLECLCRFHRKCIRQWWERKGPGVCPVHQQGS